MKQKEKAHFIFKRRYLIVKRRDGLTDQEQRDLVTMLEYVPELRTLRDFADAMQRLFAVEQYEEQARERWRRLQSNAAYLAVPELKKVLETTLSLAKFTKMIAFLRNPAAQKVRTNNHVERCNRKLRYWERCLQMASTSDAGPLPGAGAGRLVATDVAATRKRSGSDGTDHAKSQGKTTTAPRGIQRFQVKTPASTHARHATQSRVE